MMREPGGAALFGPMNRPQFLPELRPTSRTSRTAGPSCRSPSSPFRRSCCDERGSSLRGPASPRAPPPAAHFPTRVAAIHFEKAESSTKPPPRLAWRCEAETHAPQGGARRRPRLARACLTPTCAGPMLKANGDDGRQAQWIPDLVQGAVCRDSSIQRVITTWRTGPDAMSVARVPTNAPRPAAAPALPLGSSRRTGGRRGNGVHNL